MADTLLPSLAPRPDIRGTPAGGSGLVVQRSLPLGERLYNMSGLRKVFLLIALALIWEAYARWVDNELLFPTFTATIQAMLTNVANGGLPARVWVSLRILLMGYGVGIAVAAALACVAVGFRLGADLLEVLTAMFNPLPAIALLPLAMIWFGFGAGSPGVRARAFRRLGGCAQRPFRVPVGFAHATHARQQLQSPRHPLHPQNPRAGCLSPYPDRPQGRLGFRLAYPDRGGVGVWRQLRQGRTWLVHLRTQELARHSRGVRGIADRDRDRPNG